MRSRSDAAVATRSPVLAIALVGIGALTWFAFSPGLINADTVDMLQQAVSGAYHDWHSPAMTRVLAVIGTIGPAASMMLLIENAIFLLGLYLALSHLLSGTWMQLVAAGLLIFSPPIFATLTCVNKDALGLAFFVLGIGFYVRGLAPGPLLPRLAWMIPLLLATLVRPDYLAYVLAFGALWLWSTIRISDSSFLAMVGRVTVALLFACALTTAMFAAASVVNYQLLNVTRAYPLQATLLYDIAGVSYTQGENRFPDWVKAQGVTRESIRRQYSPAAPDPLFWGEQPRIRFTRNPEDYRDLLSAWAGAVVSGPGAYLAHRAGIGKCLLSGCSDPHWKYQYETDRRFEGWLDYGKQGLDSPVLGKDARNGYLAWAAPLLLSNGPFYAAVLILALGAAWALAIRGPAGAATSRLRMLGRVNVALSCGALLNFMFMLLAAPASVFRYLTPTIFVAILCLVVGCELVRLRWRAPTAADERAKADSALAVQERKWN